MIQFGCPYSKDAKSKKSGTGGPNPNTTFNVNGAPVKRNAGGNIPDEFTQKITNEVGTLSMANTGRPNSGGSQFFINVKHNEFLDWWRSDLSNSQHPVFAKIADGLDIVLKISNVKTNSDNPVTPITVKSITVVQ